MLVPAPVIYTILPNVYLQYLTYTQYFSAQIALVLYLAYTQYYNSVPIPVMYTRTSVCCTSTLYDVHIQSYSVDQSQEPVAEPYLSGERRGVPFASQAAAAAVAAGRAR